MGERRVFLTIWGQKKVNDFTIYSWFLCSKSTDLNWITILDHTPKSLKDLHLNNIEFIWCKNLGLEKSISQR